MALVLEPGALIGGRYRLEQLLGRGGMGEVWAAEQSVTRQRVAMKFLIAADKQGASETENAATRKRFLREARAACAVVHPNVVKVHDVIEVDDGTPALIMELLRGESLEARLARDGKLTADETLAIITRVVSAVGTAHAHGVVHRDLKPDNIFLVETGDGIDVKVVDFGIAKLAATDSGPQTAALTATNAMLGTPYYMSPEQAFGEKRIDHRADIWSLGIVMYRCLTGQLPTQAENLGQILKIIMTRSIPKLADIAPGLPKELATLVDSMLSYAPEDRPNDLREVKAVLERIHAVGVGDFGPPVVDTLAATANTAVPGVTATQPIVGAAAPATRRLPPAAYALGAALLLAVGTVVAVTVKRKSPSPDVASASPAAAASAPASSGAEAPPARSVETSAEPAHGPPVETASATPTASGAPLAKSATARVTAGAKPRESAVSATPTTQPGAASSLGGIVTKPGF